MKKNVLQLVGSFHQGGSERQAVQLARLLHQESTFRVFVAALDGAGMLREEVERLQLGEIPNFPLASFYDANFICQLTRCARFIRTNNIEVVHTHDFYTNVFGMAAAQVAGVRARIASKRETGAMRSRAQVIAEKLAFRAARKIVVNASAVREFLLGQNVDERKITVIYNGLDLTRLQPRQSQSETLRELNLPVDKKLITLVANLRHRVKNQPMFLRAAQRVKKKFADVVFVLAGEGELLDELKALAVQLNIEADVRFIGRCTKVAELLSISEVCALSSVAEGFSNAILEYMAAARPVVATNVGGAAEAIVAGETGFLVASDDDEAMAEKILFLLQNPEIADQFGKRGREIVQAKFSLETQLEQTLRLYSESLRF